MDLIVLFYTAYKTAQNIPRSSCESRHTLHNYLIVSSYKGAMDATNRYHDIYYVDYMST